MTDKLTHSRLSQLLQAAYWEALKATHPARLLAPYLSAERRPDFILAFGKASLPMAHAAQQAYPQVPTLVVTPVEGQQPGDPHDPWTTICYSSHPVPDERSVAAAQTARQRLAELKDDQEALVLVSGGGSALLCAPQGVSLAQKQTLTRQLLLAGADIREVNTVRRHLSAVKGGRLAQATRARIRALLLSDVVGDDLKAIASGPTVPDPTTFADALAVLERYAIAAPKARRYFESGAADTPDTLPRVTNQVVGSNRLLLAAAQGFLTSQGVQSVILGDTFEGEARELARFHAAVVESIRRFGTPVKAPVVLLSGGEANVTVHGPGQGGRNQEFALALLLAPGGRGVTALSAGSDGIDGNSRAAGAFLTPDSLRRAAALGLDARRFLDRNDSATFFERLGDSFITGLTGQNLNDFRAIFVESGQG